MLSPKKDSFQVVAGDVDGKTNGETARTRHKIIPIVLKPCICATESNVSLFVEFAPSFTYMIMSATVDIVSNHNFIYTKKMVKLFEYCPLHLYPV